MYNKICDVNMDDEILELAKSLVNLYEEAYNLYEPMVQGIIDNKIRDINYIEKVIDHVMDIYTEKGFYLCIQLILYYSMVNYDNAKEYIEILKESREDEYQEFIKKIKKEEKKLKKELQ